MTGGRNRGPEIVASDDEAVDDTEPATTDQPIIDIVPMSEPIVVESSENDLQFADEGDDDEAEHAEIVTVTDDVPPLVVRNVIVTVPSLPFSVLRSGNS